MGSHGNIKSAADTVMKWLAPEEGSLVLDAGSGHCEYLEPIRRRSARYVGLDLSGHRLRQAGRKFPGSWLVNGDCHSMPFRSRLFDSIACNRVYHHLSDKKSFLAEIRRILKTGGRLVILSWSHEQLSAFPLFHYFPAAWEAEKIRIPDIANIVRHLTSEGFRDFSMERCWSEDAARMQPVIYLDKAIREKCIALSTLGEKEIEAGISQIQEDLINGSLAGVMQIRLHELKKIGGNVTVLKAGKA